ncbi:MAG: hypothetical protein H8D45_22735 [Bacteroidetes bacterium]|nr:hypothetical protein [Bacteroidota bacterium]
MKNQIIKTIVISIAIIAINLNVSAQCVQCDENSSATGDYSSVIGMSTLATAEGTFAGGYGSEANGSLSFAFGNQVIAGGTNSVVIGRFLETTVSPAMVFGTGGALTDKLTNGISNSLMIGFNSNKPTLFVKGAPGNGYTGSIGIGDVTNPLAKLHIKADDGEQAALFIEPNVFGSEHDAELWMGTSDYGLTAAYGKMYFNTGGNYIFNSTGANMGIGVILPTEKLQVNGNIKQSAGYYVSTDKVQATGTEGLNLFNHNGTGIFVSPDGNVGIGISSTPYRLTVNGTIFTNSNAYIAGNVGIGTDSPQEKLHVNGNQLITGNLDVNGTVNAGSFSGDGSGLTNVDDGDWTINGNDIYRLNGNVGIGITSPDSKLTIVDGAGKMEYGSYGLTLSTSTYGPVSLIKFKNFYGNHWTLQHTNDVSPDFQIIYNTLQTLYIDDNGDVKIGTGTPQAKLDVGGSLKVHDNILLNGNWLSGDGADEGVFVDNLGKVGIGNSSPDAELDVSGEIKATSLTIGTLNVEEFTTDYLTVVHKIEAGEIEVKEIDKWKDEVFEENYPLPSLSQVEQYIKENKHLPDIPSEAEVLENGINVGEMNALLLQKIEELTLYVIELENRIKELENKK